MDARLGSTPQEDVACDAGQSPIVLTLQERTARESVDAHRYVVHTLVELVRDIPFAGQVGILGIAHEQAVDPYVVAMPAAVEAEENVAPVPIVGQGELASVRAHGVLLLVPVGEPTGAVGHDAPRLVVVAEGVGDVHVQRFVPGLAVSHSVNLPGRGHLYVVPGRSVERVFIEVVVCLFRCAHPLELPRSVQAQHVGRSLQRIGGCVGRSGCSGIRHGHVQRVRPLAVQTVHIHVIPFFQGLCCSHVCQCRSQKKQIRPFHDYQVLGITFFSAKLRNIFLARVNFLI